MATTDQMCEVQRPLAEFAYDLKRKYKDTYGMSKANFMAMYDAGEVQLSSVFENLLVIVRKANGGRKLTKVSESSRDFSNNGDMKTGVLHRNGHQRRFVISAVQNKIGTIYFIGWNWMTNRPCFYAIPRPPEGFPACGIKIMRCPTTGDATGGKYNLYEYDSFEEMSLVD